MYIKKKQRIYIKLKIYFKIITYCLLRPFIGYILPNKFSLYGHTTSSEDRDFEDYIAPSSQDFIEFIELGKKLRYSFSDSTSYLNINQKSILLTFDDGFKAPMQNLYPYLIKNKIPFIICIIGDSILNNSFKIKSLNSNHNFLSGDDINYLKKNNVEVAFHTMSHINISKNLDSFISSKELQKKELSIDNSITSYFTTPLIFSYPYHSPVTSDVNINDLVKEFGFKYILDTNNKIILPQNNTIFRVPVDLPKEYEGLVFFNPILFNLMFASIKLR